MLFILWILWDYYYGKDFEVSSADCLFVGIIGPWLKWLWKMGGFVMMD